MFLRRMRDCFTSAPILDTEAMCHEISEKTGIPYNMVITVIDAETDYMLKTGIAYETKGGKNRC